MSAVRRSKLGESMQLESWNEVCRPLPTLPWICTTSVTTTRIRRTTPAVVARNVRRLERVFLAFSNYPPVNWIGTTKALPRPEHSIATRASDEFWLGALEPRPDTPSINRLLLAHSFEQMSSAETKATTVQI